MNNATAVFVLALIEVISVIAAARLLTNSPNVALYELGIGTLCCLGPLFAMALSPDASANTNLADEPFFWFAVVNAVIVAMAIYMMRIFHLHQEREKVQCAR
jgi:hypothetical protein